MLLYLTLLSKENSGRGGGLVVSVLAFHSDDLSTIHAEVYNFSVKFLLKRTKINKKRPGLTHFFLKKVKKFEVSNPIKLINYI